MKVISSESEYMSIGDFVEEYKSNSEIGKHF